MGCRRLSKNTFEFSQDTQDALEAFLTSVFVADEAQNTADHYQAVADTAKANSVALGRTLDALQSPAPVSA